MAAILDADSRRVPDHLKDDRNDFADRGSDEISPDRYLSKGFQQSENDLMWPRVWQMACHQDQIQTVGDYIIYEIAGRSLIVVRTGADTVKAYHNTCLHRGRMLCESGGHAQNFRCKYHGFMWKLSGELGFVPAREDFPGLDERDLNLPEAKVGQWAGFVFINLDPQAAPLEEYLGDLPDRFKDWRFESRRLVGHVGQVIRANWKVCTEAFLEFYHGMATHPEAMVTSSDAETRYVVRKEYPHTAHMVIPQAVASPWMADKVDDQKILDALFAITGTAPDERIAKLPPGKGVREYWADLARARMAAMTGRDFSDVSDTEMIDIWVYALFPNLAIWGGYMSPFVFRFRPWQNDPGMALMEIFIIPEMPEGAPRPPAPKMTLLGPDQTFNDSPELAGIADFLNQDLGNLEWVQRGLKGSVRKAILLTGYQESEVRQFHHTLDSYIFRGGPGAATD